MNQTLFAIKTEGENRLQLFWVNYSGQEVTNSDQSTLAKLLSDPVDQTFWINPSETQWSTLHFESLQLVHFRPGVTDNPAHSFKELIEFHPLFKGKSPQVFSGEITLKQKGDSPIRFNQLIQVGADFPSPGPVGSELVSRKFIAPNPKLAPVEHIKLHGLSTDELSEMSRTRFWALSVEEMLVIQKYYGKREATDLEMEVLAQTWSEHCKHKIFAANINYEENGTLSRIEGLFKTYIQKPTFDFQKEKDWAISVFKDNAGIVRFHEAVDVCIKVETHNSPSALDPYGGALTGILGVNRDILGTGLGARPIANTNVLLFGNPDETEALPEGLFHPREILKGVHKGIQDGGNKSGIPTVNGAMIFDESFSGKPLVFCGTVGVLPRTVNGVPSASKNQRPGDLIVMAGGAVGYDGIHGATSSSLALDSNTPSTMVQIGDPLTQKRLMDFLLEARDLGLYNSLTDNGAGGLSSSIGEMASETNGARVDLDQVPLKYPGLKPWQILISESQERMTFSVPREKWPEMAKLAKLRSVEASVVGEFTNSGILEIKFQGETVGKLELSFLHDGLPKMELEAVWSGPRKNISWKKNTPIKAQLKTIHDALTVLVKDPSLASKEKWVRQYDHEVQGATVVKPFEGMKNSAPNDGGVIWMGAHGNPGFSGIVVSSGLCPEVSQLDPKIMAIMAADEAVRNAIVTGANPEQIALIDNFCWPDPLPGPKNPDAKHKLAELVRTCQGLEQLVRAYGMPLVSGKDSMKNDFIGTTPDGREVKISVLPTLLVTALSGHPDVRRALKPHASSGSTIYLLESQGALPGNAPYFGTTLSKGFEVTSASTLDFDLMKARKFYQTFYEATLTGLIASAHDVSEGGVLFSLFEKLMLNQLGIQLNQFSINELFGEAPGRIVVSVNPDHIHGFESHFAASVRTRLGTVNTSGEIRVPNFEVSDQNESLSVKHFADLWRNSV
jgi:phosphoribosylformylglycinamidine synthase II